MWHSMIRFLTRPDVSRYARSRRVFAAFNVQFQEIDRFIAGSRLMIDRAKDSSPSRCPAHDPAAVGAIRDKWCFAVRSSTRRPRRRRHRRPPLRVEVAPERMARRRGSGSKATMRASGARVLEIQHADADVRPAIENPEAKRIGHEVVQTAYRRSDRFAPLPSADRTHRGPSRTRRRSRPDSASRLPQRPRNRPMRRHRSSRRCVRHRR